jgi:CheY-like chemotaxis protein
MQPLTILIADPDPVWSGSIARLLESEGYRVLLARTGADAYYQACTRRPDLLLLSPHLSQRTGWEVCRRLRQEPGLERLKIVMLSPDGQRAYRAGADGYLIKGGQVEPTLPPVRAFRQPAAGILAEFQHRRALAA